MLTERDCFVDVVRILFLLLKLILDLGTTNLLFTSENA